MNQTFYIIVAGCMILCTIFSIISLIVALTTKSHLQNSLNHLREKIIKENDLTREVLADRLGDFSKEMSKDSFEQYKEMNRTLKDSLSEIRNTNEKKLSDIQANVNEKLDKSLNERLDTSFKNIGDMLSNVNKQLGELQTLSTGVVELKNTLVNVKSRGIFGEKQLENILANTLDRSQYQVQFQIKKGNKELVDFAIKIPDKGVERGYIYLPIDSKFPADMYNKIVDAANSGNATALKTATKQLEDRIKEEAKSISEKYLLTGVTTEFAIMFLPTEGLYSEVLRIDGLSDFCQNKYHVLISGPTTVVALINSLNVGFRYLAVNENSKKILKTLQSIKSQYDKFGDQIMRTQEYIDKASDNNKVLSERSYRLQSELNKTDSLMIEDREQL